MPSSLSAQTVGDLASERQPLLDRPTWRWRQVRRPNAPTASRYAENHHPIQSDSSYPPLLDGRRDTSEEGEGAMKIRTQLKAGGSSLNHNDALRRAADRPAVSMPRQIPTTARKGDRLELLVVRAGLRAGGRAARYGRR